MAVKIFNGIKATKFIVASCERTFRVCHKTLGARYAHAYKRPGSFFGPVLGILFLNVKSLSRLLRAMTLLKRTQL